MMRRMFTALRSLKIKYKILACMMLITTAALLFISLLSYRYFASVYQRDARDNARYTLQVTSVTVRNHMDNILKNTSIFVSGNPMYNSLKDIVAGSQSRYIGNYNDVQDPLEQLIQKDRFISNVFVSGKNKEFFALSKYGLNHDLSDYLGPDIRNRRGIFLLPIRPDPLMYFNNVIPMVIPIAQLSQSASDLNPIIAGDTGSSIANIYILLDAPQINAYLQELNKSKDSLIYLADHDGVPLSLSGETGLSAIALSGDVRRMVSQNDAFSEFTLSDSGETFMGASVPVGICNLRMVSLVSRTNLLSGINTIQSFIWLAWAMSFLLTLALSLFLSQFITRPFKILMNVVRSIQDGSYQTRRQPRYRDEAGILLGSLNTMKDTIDLQMEVIRQEAQERASAEIAALAEQINPHFLYNTLECIRWEILRDKPEAAASMVESLGEFLRTSLNSAPVIPVLQEIRHTEEYIRLINHRSGQYIALTSHVDEALAHFGIVKLVLQPLAENCIRHGFAEDVRNGRILSPAIHISVTRPEPGLVQLEVSDNGRGIDIDTATAALYHLPGGHEKHVGLHNVYKRLRLHFGNQTQVTFSTTPYFHNAVRFVFPVRADDSASDPH